MFVYALILLVAVFTIGSAEFQVKIKNLAGNTYNISCPFVAQSNYYGTVRINSYL